MLALKNKECVKFTKDGRAKIHADVLKLRTRCAMQNGWSLGQGGKNAPDDRCRRQRIFLLVIAWVRNVRMNQNRVLCTKPQREWTSRCARDQAREKRDRNVYVEYPYVWQRRESLVFEQNLNCCRGERKRGEQLEIPFVGVTTSACEGIVDTAAQDGLIGKAVLLRLAAGTIESKHALVDLGAKLQ